MLYRDDITGLIRKYNLMRGEVDHRHMELINEVYQHGINVGINHAKECIEWRHNGAMWVKFIEDNIRAGS